MRKHLLVGTAFALVAFVEPSMAADMSPAPAVYTKAAPQSSNGWGGFYIGINGGYGWGDTTINPALSASGVVLPNLNPFANPKPAGFLFGGQVGYNWEVGPVVAGLVVDYDAANMTDSQTVTAAGLGAGVTHTLATKVDALASARAKIGFDIGGRILLFGTGGAAWGHGSATESLAAPGGLAISQVAVANQFGWVAGGGIDFQLMQHVVLGIEALHYDFGTAQFAFNPIAGAAAPVFQPGSAQVQVNVARGTLGYRF